jgi:excisionase family DNA binding protein
MSTKTVPEAAAICGVSPRTYYSAVARGEAPAIRIGHRLIVPEQLLERFLAGERFDRREAVPLTDHP